VEFVVMNFIIGVNFVKKFGTSAHRVFIGVFSGRLSIG
jgi:hypothetical protein